MRLITITAAAACAALAMPLAAGPVKATANTQPVGEDGNNAESCFGEWRAWYATYLAEVGAPHGRYISRRAGSNPDVNQAWIDTWCPDSVRADDPFAE